jgi:hypothetical protein
MGSAEVCRPPSNRFWRVYHFIPPEHAESTITNRSLKVTRFAEANDPFELLALRIAGKAQKLAALEYRELFDEKNGMLCFSRNWTSPALWSHYASRHKGVCLGFDLDRSNAHEVKYARDRVALDMENQAGFNVLPDHDKLRLFATKSLHWEYEAEMRFFVDLSRAIARDGMHFWPFSEELVLREVILGPSCTLPTDHVRAITNTYPHSVVVFNARLAVHSFNIVPKEKTVP